MPRFTPFVLVALLAACGGGGGGSPATGTLRLALADAPACGYDTVHVTVERVRVHQSAGAGDADGGWVDLALASPRRVDLLTLTNGVLEELGQVELPAGRYTQLRLVLAANGGATPLANAVKPTGATEIALDTPSGSQSGLKLNVNLDVPAGRVADFIIDFDACKSVVPRGGSGRYNLKPVLRVLPRLSDAGARVVGQVALGQAGMTVSAQVAGEPVVSTLPDPATGRFVLQPLAAGTYDIVIAGSGYATGVVTGVPVTLTAPTVLATAPISLPSGAPRTVSAAVTATPEPESVLLRALQTLSGGAIVEVLARPADAAGTPVGLALPSAAPMVAVYSAAAATPDFNSDTATAVVGRYTVQARAVPPAPAAVLTKSTAVDVSPAVPDPLPALAFTFP